MHLLRKHPLQGLCLALFAALLTPTHAATWRSSLYPADWTPPVGKSFEHDAMIQDFSYAGYGSGSIALPSPTGPIFDVVSGYGADPSGVADSTVAIQNAIDAASTAGGGVVYLPAGTYRIIPQGASDYGLRIAASNIVLRGAGRSQTFLRNDSYSMRSKTIILVEGTAGYWKTSPSGSPVAYLTADVTGPVSSVTVSSVAGFATGDWIMLRADATDAFITEHHMESEWIEYNTELAGVMFQRQITAIDQGSKVITFDVPLRYYLKTRDGARIHKTITHITGVGLENFSIGNCEHPQWNALTGWASLDYATPGTGAYDVHDSCAITLHNVRNCWMRSVASYCPPGNSSGAHLLSNGVLLDGACRVTLDSCEFQRALYGGGGGNGYMYRLQRANECLLTQCSARYCRHGFSFFQMQTSGNVIYGGLSQASGTQFGGQNVTGIASGSDHHMWLSQSNLVDGIELDRDYLTAHYRDNPSVPRHGVTSVHSVFWNPVGLAYYPGEAYSVYSDQARDQGYIIGVRGFASDVTTYSAYPEITGPADHVETILDGNDLVPLSLYHDQLQRRLGVTIAPPVPTEALALPNDGSVDVSWNPSDGAATYTLQAATSSAGPFTSIVTGLTTTHFAHTGLTNGAKCYYRVYAINSAGYSGASQQINATPNLGLPGGTIIVDNIDWDQIAITGAWTASTITTGYNGGDYLQDCNTGLTDGTKQVLFAPRIRTSGTYNVYLRWTSGNNRANNVPVEITSAEGIVTTTINQKVSGGTWFPLGSWNFTAGQNGTVVVRTAGANGYVVADAVKFEYVPLADNADGSQVEYVGSWPSSQSVTGYYGTSYAHDNNAAGGRSATFKPAILSAGNYEVFMRWTAGGNRASNLKAEVIHDGTTVVVPVNQRLNGGEWMSLGTYHFAVGQSGVVRLPDAGADGYVIADAVKLEPRP